MKTKTNKPSIDEIYKIFCHANNLDVDDVENNINKFILGFSPKIKSEEN